MNTVVISINGSIRDVFSQDGKFYYYLTEETLEQTFVTTEQVYDLSKITVAQLTGLLKNCLVKPTKQWVSVDSIENHVGGLEVDSLLKLRNGSEITAKSFLLNYSIPEIGEVQTGVFDTNGKFHSIEEVIAAWC